MEQIVVGCVQLRMRLPQAIGEMDENLQRFARMAQSKRVRLVVLPQFAGLMAAAPVLRGTRADLLKVADQARGQNASLWQRTRARMAGSAAGMLRADFGKALEEALLTRPDDLWDSYTEVFGRIARQLAVTVVAGSTYLIDSDGAVRHMTMVFGPDGDVLGRQAAVSLAAGEHQAVEPGRQWQVIPTPIGRLGILIGNDMLYPEPGRLLAYAGAEILVGQGATHYPVQYHRQRQGLLARVEENQLYGVLSYLVGYNPFTPADELPFLGKSLVAAPLRMTPRYNNILAEMGADSAEGLITAELDHARLRDLWTEDETPLRATMPVDVAGPMLSAIYGRGLSIDQATRLGELADGPAALPEPVADAMEVDELPALSMDEEELPEGSLEGGEEPVITPAEGGWAPSTDEEEPAGEDTLTSESTEPDALMEEEPRPATGGDDLPSTSDQTTMRALEGEEDAMAADDQPPPRQWPWSRAD